MTLAVQPTIILLVDGWDLYNAPYLRLAAQICHQRAQHFGHVDVMRLDASINLQARRVDDEIAHAILFQQPMNP
jgi:hypothetical protein